MANGGRDDHDGESSPLLNNPAEEVGRKSNGEKMDHESKVEKACDAPDSPDFAKEAGFGWTTEGLPMGHGSVMGEPMNRAQWDSSLMSCLGRNDEFCSSDLEVCLLGSMAPCVLYGSNAERLLSGTGTFTNHCLPYCGLYLIGHSFFGWNCLAPWFSYPSRTAIRRKFNLEGTCETLSKSCGCCGGYFEDEERREQCESACDFATHLFCHPCALCQEGREVRRRMPHPGFNAQSVLVMLPPAEQTMGRST